MATIRGMQVLMEERHYSIAEIAQILNVSEKRVRLLFASEPGIIRLSGPTALGGGGKAGRKGWEMLRIPESVFHRVYLRLSNSGSSGNSLIGKLKRPSGRVE